MRVLIIDDEPLIGKCFSQIALSRGHKAKVELDGLKGLATWQSFQPHLVFLDILMPGLDGPSLLKKIGKKNNEKVVMMSAHKAFSDDFFIPGVDLFVPKPFSNIVSVFDKAEKLLGQKPNENYSRPI